MSGWVYVIGELGQGPAHVKIGYTAGCPWKRKATLQTGSPSLLVLLAYAPGTREDERRIHQHFAKHRAHGEWFRCEPEVLAWIAELDAAATELMGPGVLPEVPE